jgi:CRP-like cAMP-binding protein
MAYHAGRSRAFSSGWPSEEQRARDIGFDNALETSSEVLSDTSIERKVKAGSELFGMGAACEALLSLADGWVALYDLMEDGRRQILQFALPGTILAFVPTRGASVTYGAQALTDATVRIVSHDSLTRLCKEHPDFGIWLAAGMSRDRNLAYNHLSRIGCRSARERVGHLLLELYIRSRMQWPGHHVEEMHLPLTQLDIGDAIGLTGVHVNRVLRELRSEGVVEFHYHKLRILNPDKLLDVAQIDPQLAISWMRRGSAIPAPGIADPRTATWVNADKEASNGRSRTGRVHRAAINGSHSNIGTSS